MTQILINADCKTDNPTCQSLLCGIVPIFCSQSFDRQWPIDNIYFSTSKSKPWRNINLCNAISYYPLSAKSIFWSSEAQQFLGKCNVSAGIFIAIHSAYIITIAPMAQFRL